MLPAHIDLRYLLPEARDQGQRATCLAFALTAAHEVSRGGDPIEDLSEEVLYWACKRIDQNTLPTTTFSSAVVALHATGQPAEHLWPYDDKRDESSPSYTPPAAAIDQAVCHRAQLVPVTLSVSAIKNHLVSGGTVAVSLLVSYHFALTTTGVIPMPKATDQMGDYHAVLMVGFDDSLQTGSFIFRNSWGADWGDSGYGYLPYNYVQQHGVEAWAIKCLSK